MNEKEKTSTLNELITEAVALQKRENETVIAWLGRTAQFVERVSNLSPIQPCSCSARAGESLTKLAAREKERFCPDTCTCLYDGAFLALTDIRDNPCTNTESYGMPELGSQWKWDNEVLTVTKHVPMHPRHVMIRWPDGKETGVSVDWLLRRTPMDKDHSCNNNAQSTNNKETKKFKRMKAESFAPDGSKLIGGSGPLGLKISPTEHKDNK
jgi:hypothetical protein